jgi:hypothetical protein
LNPIPKKLTSYLNAVADSLARSPNQFIRSHPEISQRILALDWGARLEKLKNQFIEIYTGADLDFAPGTVAFDLDDSDFDRVHVSFSATNEYKEWIEFDMDGYEVREPGDIFEAIFADIPDWQTETRNELEILRGLLVALIELAALESVKHPAFKVMHAADGFILVSSIWHDVEKSLFYKSRQSGTNPILTAVDWPPESVEFVAARVTEQSVTILNQTVQRDTSFFRGDQSGYGGLPEEIGLLEKLEELELRHENLTELPAAVFQLTKLTKLNLNNNRLRQLPGDIARLSQLTELDLRENLLETVPATIGELRHLKRLGLEYNRLRALPDSIAALEQLEELSLYNNCLSELPRLPPGLTWLNLNENKLSELPESFRKLRRLGSLVLSGNQFTEVPAQIFELPALASLELGDNPIDDLPEALLKLPALKNIRVYPNRFSIEQRARLRAAFGDRLFVGYDSDPESFQSDS